MVPATFLPQDIGFKLADFALSLIGSDLIIDHGDTCGIIPAVFESFQAIDEDLVSVLFTNVTDNTAHNCYKSV